MFYRLQEANSITWGIAFYYVPTICPFRSTFQLKICECVNFTFVNCEIHCEIDFIFCSDAGDEDVFKLWGKAPKTQKDFN